MKYKNKDKTKCNKTHTIVNIITIYYKTKYDNTKRYTSIKCNTEKRKIIQQDTTK